MCECVLVYVPQQHHMIIVSVLTATWRERREQAVKCMNINREFRSHVRQFYEFVWKFFYCSKYMLISAVCVWRIVNDIRFIPLCNTPHHTGVCACEFFIWIFAYDGFTAGHFFNGHADLRPNDVFAYRWSFTWKIKIQELRVRERICQNNGKTKRTVHHTISWKRQSIVSYVVFQPKCKSPERRRKCSSQFKRFYCIASLLVVMMMTWTKKIAEMSSERALTSEQMKVKHIRPFHWKWSRKWFVRSFVWSKVIVGYDASLLE